MPIAGIEQPELVPVSAGIRLRKYNGFFDFALNWYQDLEMLKMLDGPNAAVYDVNKLARMYHYLDQHGELYFIEVKFEGEFMPVGDVTFSKEDMPIVIGLPEYRGKGIAKEVIKTLLKRAQTLGYDSLFVRDIYDYNLPSIRLFESCGFKTAEKTEHGHSYFLRL
jgi:RimJ/RimL family protein N-acetyltransferase